MFLPQVWRERGLIADGHGARLPSANVAGDAGCLLVAGSCSEATRRQNEWLARQGVCVTHVRPSEILDGGFDRAALVARLRRELAGGRHCLLSTSGAPADVRAAQEWGAGLGMTAGEFGEAVSGALAAVARGVLEAQPVGGLVVAGGETSGALCRHLRLGALHVGRNIEPGVPVCYSLGEFRLPVVLKSGNFGGEDFYGKALRAVAGAGEFFA
jgi:uncharacterized protein YgbK (DUF1537 family)